jgi:hypothetical protein
MKKAIVITIARVIAIVIVIATVIAIVAISNVYFTSNATENLYAKNSVCIKVDTETDEVFFETDNGHIFSIFGCEDWCENDNCIIVFDSQGTVEVVDDTIVTITYIG